MDAKNNGMRLSRLLLPALLFVLCLAPLSATAGDDKYSAEELDEIVGPIALYPDVVISSMLPASTVPTDVVQAARWVAVESARIVDFGPDDKPHRRKISDHCPVVVDLHFPHQDGG